MRKEHRNGYQLKNKLERNIKECTVRGTSTQNYFLPPGPALSCFPEPSCTGAANNESSD